jgi:addiction module HigA family antidote
LISSNIIEPPKEDIMSVEFVARHQMRAPTHPGEILREDVIPALRITVKEMAEALGVTRQTLHKILNGTAAVTPEMALRLGKFCGNGPDLWLRLQQAHDLWKARQALGDQLDRIPSRNVA